ncbi:MAG: type III pantothenate kinase [Bacteroidetes bacterium]|nr:type III pantothenate kinase [Bacteroidota bacterium]
MFLTADIGNTRIKYALWNEDRIIVETGQPADFEELYHRVLDVDAFAWCSTIGDLPEKFHQLEIKSLELTPKIRLPFVNEYKTPSTLGRDRMATAAGAMHRHPGKTVAVMDAGTCITTDVVTADGVYKGGSISPGLEMRYKALNTFTEKLPLIRHRADAPLIGQNTEESILSGVSLGIIGELNHRMELLHTEYPDIAFIGTGGDGPFFADKLKFSIFAEPFIIHYGLLSCFILNET